MTTLTQDYLEAHRPGLHTAESWARSMSESIFNAAAQQLETASHSQVTVPAEFTIEAFTPAGCVRICGTIGGVRVCYHAKI